MMNEKSRNGILWIILIVLVVLGFVYLSGPNTTEESESGPIRVGVITPLTGDAAVYGTAMQRAYDLAVEEINTAGGVDGRELSLIYEDGKCDGTTATTAAQKLVNVDQVKFILGGTCSGETLAAAELTQTARVLLLSPSATSPDITDSGDLVYRTYPSDDFEAQKVAAYATEQGWTKAAVISENTDFAQGVRKAFQNVFGGEIVFDEDFNTGETDFRTLVTKMKEAEAEFLYLIPQSPVAGELVLKQMDEADLNLELFGANTLLDRTAFAENPVLFEGMFFSEVQLDESSTATSEMLAAYEAKYGSAPEFSGFTASAYDSVYLIAEALEEEGVDPEEVAEYFDEDVSDWPGAVGVFNFDENGDAEIELSLVVVKDGELVSLEDAMTAEETEVEESEETEEDEEEETADEE